MRQSVKKIFFYLLKVGISATLVWMAVRRIEPENFWTYVQSLPVSLLILTILGSVVNLLLQFIRFRLIIDECRHEINNPELIKVFFMGFAFRLTVPGGHGEAAKMLLFPEKPETELQPMVLKKSRFLQLFYFCLVLPLFCFFLNIRFFYSFL